MLPQDGNLSSTAQISGFSYPVKSPLPEDQLQDWELAGVDLNDASQGLLVKVWRLEGVTNPDTDEVELYVSAPGSPRTLLFSGLDITEASLSFDQNMNPFVAYHQGSAAKIYWYDPLLPGMTHTTLPAGTRTMRCTMDERRDVFVADSDIILAYVRAGNFCIRYQRERFTVEHIMRAGVGANCELVSMARNNGHRMQWRFRNYELTNDPGALIQVEPFLADAVQLICRRAGVPPESIDVTELYGDTVPGLKIQNDDGLDKPIDALREIFLFDKSQYDKKLRFPKRGRGPVARIPYVHLTPKAPASLKKTFVDEQELPREVTLNHLDSTGGFAPNNQRAFRRSNFVTSKKKEKIETDVVLTPDQAATAAARILKVRWNEQIDYEFTTTIRYSFVTPGDVVEVEDADGTWHRIRIEEKNEDTGNIDWEGKQDAGNRAYEARQGGQHLDDPVSTTPGLVTETLLEIVDSSPLLDQDDELGLYVAAAGVPGGTWQGYQLLVSVDGGVSYVEALSTAVPSTIGESVTDLANETVSGHDFVSAETFEVTTNFPLSSVTSSQIAAGANRFCVGGEIGQFETATLVGMVGPLYHYTLSGLRRAKYGTTAPLWPAGTRFVLLDETVAFVQAQRAMVGVDLEYKPVSYGKTVDETVPTDYLFDEPASQIEWTPDDVAATRDVVSNDVTVTFTPRPRLGQFGTPFNSKYFRGHRVKFSDDHVIDTYNATAVYAAAPPGVTVQVCGLNEITGEGPYSAPVTPT